jgi:hypothetical protein
VTYWAKTELKENPMRSDLAEIDAIFRQYDEMKYLIKDFGIGLKPVSFEALEGYHEKMDKISPLYDTGYKQLDQLAPTLTTQDIIEAFEQGSRSLKGYMCDQMYRRFDPTFVPTMIQAIKDDFPVSYRFIGILTDYLSIEEMLPVIDEALKSKIYYTVDTAVGYIREKRCTQYIPQLEALTAYRAIGEFVKEVIEYLRSAKE